MWRRVSLFFKTAWRIVPLSSSKPKSQDKAYHCKHGIVLAGHVQTSGICLPQSAVTDFSLRSTFIGGNSQFKLTASYKHLHTQQLPLCIYRQRVDFGVKRVQRKLIHIKTQAYTRSASILTRLPYFSVLTAT